MEILVYQTQIAPTITQFKIHKEDNSAVDHSGPI